MSVQSVVAALRSSLNASNVALGDGEKPATATTRYIVAWFDSGTTEDRSLASRDGFSAVGTFHCYGTTPDAARFAYDKLKAAVLGLHRQTVGGLSMRMPENLTALPLQRDDDLNPPLFDAVCEWRFRAA